MKEKKKRWIKPIVIILAVVLALQLMLYGVYLLTKETVLPHLVEKQPTLFSKIDTTSTNESFD